MDKNLSDSEGIVWLCCQA